MRLFRKKNKDDKNIPIEKKSINIEKKSINFDKNIYYVNDIYGNNSGFIFDPLSKNSKDMIDLYYQVEPLNTGLNEISKAKKEIKPYIYNIKTREYYQDNDLIQLLLYPCYNQTYNELIEQVNLYKKLTGNVFYIVKSNNPSSEIMDLYVISPSNVSMQELQNNFPISYTVNNFLNSQLSFNIDTQSTNDASIDRPRYFDKTGNFELIHDNGINLIQNKHEGNSKLMSIYLHSQRYLKIMEHNISLVDNGIFSSLIFTFNNNNTSCDYLTDEQFNRLQDQLKTGHSGSSHAGKPILLENGLKAESFKFTDKEMNFLECIKFDRKSIFSNLGVPLALVGEEDTTYNSYPESRLSLYQNTVIPEMQEFFDFINNRIIKYRYTLNDNEILTYKADEIETLQKTKFDTNVKLIEAIAKLGKPNLVSDNELREKLGLSPKIENNKNSKLNEENVDEETDEDKQIKQDVEKILKKSNHYNDEEIRNIIENWDNY